MRGSSSLGRRLVFGALSMVAVLGAGEGLARASAGPAQPIFLFERDGLGGAPSTALFPSLARVTELPTPNERPADQPWFEPADSMREGSSRWRRNPRKLMAREIDAATLTVPASPGITRVACLGGSTVFGIPGAINDAYSDSLATSLLALDPGAWEVHNFGNPALDSFDLVEITAEILNFEVDVVVIYAGENDTGNAFFRTRFAGGEPAWVIRARVELWNHFRLYSLARDLLIPAREQAARALGAPADAADAAKLRRQLRDTQRVSIPIAFAENLEKIVAMARERGVDVVFVQPASDLTAAPGASEHFTALDAEAEREFDAAMVAARRKAPELASLRRTVALDPTFAEASWRLGMELLATGQDDEGRRWLEEAREWDVVHVRAWNGVTAAMATVAERERVPMLDAAAVLADERGLPDPGYFVDNVHLDIDGHHQLAGALVPIVRSLQR